MTAAPVGIKSDSGKDRVYMNSVAFVIPKLKANIIVSKKKAKNCQKLNKYLFFSY